MTAQLHANHDRNSLGTSEINRPLSMPRRRWRLSDAEAKRLAGLSEYTMDVTEIWGEATDPDDEWGDAAEAGFVFEYEDGCYPFEDRDGGFWATLVCLTVTDGQTRDLTVYDREGASRFLGADVLRDIEKTAGEKWTWEWRGDR